MRKHTAYKRQENHLIQEKLFKNMHEQKSQG